MARMEMAGAEMAPKAEPKPSAESLFELGIIYATGNDGEPDLIAAHKWFNLAAVSGNAEAAYHRQEIAREMSPADIAEAQRAAREWLKTHH
jgi:TPR repeat protein